jgi:HYR domain-containing protein
MMRRVLTLCAIAGFAAPVATTGDPPRVTVPPDLTVEAQSFAGAAVTYSASAVDDRGRPIPVTCNPPSGSTFPIGPTSVTCTATDDEETTTRRFTITVADRTPPTLAVPSSRVVRTTRAGVIVTFSATATTLSTVPSARHVPRSPALASRSESRK